MVEPNHAGAGDRPNGQSAATVLPADAPTKVAPVAPVPVGASGFPEVPGFEILRLLGRGGMGQVFLARDLKLHRQVALKMLLGWASLDDRMRQRFDTEVQAVARLQHPNIAAVYEAGEVAGQPYFSMEYIAGGSLAEVIAGQPQPPNAAAVLIAVLAEAMQYAHQQGVLHRDLKPANILISPEFRVQGAAEGEGERLQAQQSGLRPCVPKITDFGLAKQLGSEVGQTRSGDILGTPGYMAPEQASGLVKEVGTAADIYALGAILYELLTGRPPFQGLDPMATLMDVILADPVPPRVLQPRLPKDLETITLKCLAKAAKKRYATAGDLAADLRRFLAGQPIHARPTPWWERGWKWVRRHPTIALLLVVLFLSSLLLGWGYWSVTRAYQQRQAGLWVAQEAVQRMLSDAAEPLKEVPQTDEIRRSMLADAAILFKAILKLEPNDAKGEEMAALAARRLGDIYREQGQVEQALEMYHAAQEKYETLLARWPAESSYLAGKASVRHGRGQLRAEEGKPAEAMAEYRAALAAFDQLATPGFQERQTRARTANNLAVLLRQQGQTEAAAELHRRVLAERQTMLAERPDDPSLQLDLAASAANLGVLLMAADRHTEALAQFNLCRDLLAKPAEKQSSARFNLGKAMANRAAVLERLAYPAGDLKRTAEVQEPAFRQALDEFHAADRQLRQVVKDQPHRPEARFVLASNLLNLGLAHGRRRQDEPAAECFRAAIQELQPLVEQQPDQAAYAQTLDLCRKLLAEVTVGAPTKK